MGWEETLDRYGVLIDAKLRNFFAEAKNAARTYHPFIEKVYSNMEEFVLRRGKRLASCSTLLAYKGYTGDIDDQILTVCVGIELYRHSILVHDDLVDKDKFRRGRKTFHRMFAEENDGRLGYGTAVFTGDMMYSLAVQSIANSGFVREQLGTVLSMLFKGYSDVNESQILDLLFESEEPNVEEWYIMASKRAASLFKTTILVGASLGNAPETDLHLLGEAAAHLGYSFDIQDDIIDTFASLEQYGRPPGGDLVLGKKPLHVIYTLKRADQNESNMLKSLFGKKHISEESLESIREIVRHSSGLKAAKEKLRGHGEKAMAMIAQTGLNNETKEFFASLITYIEKSLNWYM
jgi:geranylgeranyl pyrophosphate synthase